MSLAAHYDHIKDGDWEVLCPKLMHIVYPREELCEEACQPLPENVKCVVGVLHKNAHYSVMEIDVEAKVVQINDGLNWPLLGWFDHIVHEIMRCKLVGLTVVSSSMPDNAQSVVLGSTRQATKCVWITHLPWTMSSRGWRGGTLCSRWVDSTVHQ